MVHMSVADVMYYFEHGCDEEHPYRPNFLYGSICWMVFYIKCYYCLFIDVKKRLELEKIDNCIESPKVSKELLSLCDCLAVVGVAVFFLMKSVPLLALVEVVLALFVSGVICLQLQNWLSIIEKRGKWLKITESIIVVSILDWYSPFVWLILRAVFKFVKIKKDEGVPFKIQTRSITCPVCENKVMEMEGICSKCKYKPMFPKYSIHLNPEPLLGEVREKIYYESEYYKCTSMPYQEVINDIGVFGEYIVEGYLNGLYNSKSLRYDYKILYNLLIPEKDGSFQEIDALAIVEGNIFVFEIKNRKGRFEIPSFSERNWYQHMGDSIYEMYSPIWQNEQHIAALIELFQEKYEWAPKISNFVLFPDDFQYDLKRKISEFDTLQVGTSTVVTPLARLTEEIEKAVRSYHTNVNDVTHKLCKSEVFENDLLYEFLKPYTQYSQGEREWYMLQREKNVSSKRGSYKYGYIQPTEGKRACFLRTNGLYWQSYSKDIDMFSGVGWSNIWAEDFEKLEIDKIEWLDIENEPIRLLEAMNGELENKVINLNEKWQLK